MNQQADQSMSPGWSRKARLVVDQPISYLMQKALENPGLISLAAGFVDDATLPTQAVREQVQAMLSDEAAGQAALQYGTTAGYEPLRQELYRRLCQLDGLDQGELPGSADNIVVTNGSQQMLHLLGEVLLDEGDIVVTSRPSYFVYTGALAAVGAVVRSVPIDEHGMVPSELRKTLESIERIGQLHLVKMLYVCSYHQNPTGITLATDRREELLNIVREFSDRAGHRIVLLEDNAYRELTYDMPSDGVLPSIKQYDHDNAHVALLHTISKPFAPGLKIGYGLLPDAVTQAVLRAKGGRDFGSNNFAQHLLHRCLTTDVFDQHLSTLRQAYQTKRDAMLASLDEHFGAMVEQGVSWTVPSGGLYVWLCLPESIDTGFEGQLFQQSVEQVLLYVSGAICYPRDPAYSPRSHEIRLSFGVPTVEQIQQGIEILAKTVGTLIT